MSLAPLRFYKRNSVYNAKNGRAHSDKDSDLVKKCQNGERAAQHELYQRYKDWVYNIAFRMTNHKQETEDISQMVFLQVFRKINSFRGESAFSSWLYRITVNICMNHFKKEKKRKEKIMNEISSFQTTHSREFIGKDEQFSLKPHLEKAISALPEGYRMIFILHDMEGYNHKEIGKMMNIAEGTSKSQLHKARNELKNLLAPYLILNSTI